MAAGCDVTIPQVETVYGPWDYKEQAEPWPYDDTPTYDIAASWVDGHGLVEDWGCGTAWMERYLHESQYRGIDGAWSKWAEAVVDLREYRSNAPCAVMRHVLEHNADWRPIADNFAHSWFKRAALVLFIPPQVEDLDVGGPEWPVPDIAVSGPDLFRLLAPTDMPAVKFYIQELHYPPEDAIQWGWEGVVMMERSIGGLVDA